MVGDCHGDHHRPRAGADTVLARIIDNHQFGLLTVSLVLSRWQIRFLTSVSLTRLFSERNQSPGTYHVVLAERRAGAVVCVAVFLLSDLIGDVLNNPTWHR